MCCRFSRYFTYITTKKLHFSLTCVFYWCLVKDVWALKVIWQFVIRGLVAYKPVAYKKNKSSVWIEIPTLEVVFSKLHYFEMISIFFHIFTFLYFITIFVLQKNCKCFHRAEVLWDFTLNILFWLFLFCEATICVIPGNDCLRFRRLLPILRGSWEVAVDKGIFDFYFSFFFLPFFNFCKVFFSFQDSLKSFVIHQVPCCFCNAVFIESLLLFLN